ncbi:peptide methionine sulfoxide reductase MsrA [Clostridia bacterium]|nr:peptide methionine sulfoxide reductase MsrA [Clostridia bacterium]
MNTIYLAGGCFWGTEKYFGLIEGVVSTRVGYANGHTADPTYQDVCHNNTGHTETVEVEYDTAIVTLAELLGRYFMVIDPTLLNRQGHDIGSQYRTGIYWVDPDDEAVVKTALDALQTQYDEPIVVEMLPLAGFYPAEEYHQNYLNKNPNGYCHISPAMFKKAASKV